MVLPWMENVIFSPTSHYEPAFEVMKPLRPRPIAALVEGDSIPELDVVETVLLERVEIRWGWKHAFVYRAREDADRVDRHLAMFFLASRLLGAIARVAHGLPPQFA